MAIGAWLRSLGLGRYQAAFRDSAIDGVVLPHLTVEDLKELGVATVGDRRKLLAAIAALGGETPKGRLDPRRGQLRKYRPNVARSL